MDNPDVIQVVNYTPRGYYVILMWGKSGSTNWTINKQNATTLYTRYYTHRVVAINAACRLRRKLGLFKVEMYDMTKAKEEKIKIDGM